MSMSPYASSACYWQAKADEAWELIRQYQDAMPALQKDAERYRWLRDVGDETWRPLCARVKVEAAVIDDAIDAAMKEAP